MFKGLPDAKDSDGDDHHSNCGIGRFRPRCLQRCANIKAYTAVYSLILMLHLAYVSYFVGTVRTVEKRFGLTSTKSSFLINASDIAQTSVVILVGYIGRKLHKPRFLGTSVLLCGLGALLAAAPFFIYGPYQYDPALLRAGPPGGPGLGGRGGQGGPPMGGPGMRGPGGGPPGPGGPNNYAPEEPVFDHNMTGPDAPLPPAARGGRGRMNRGPRLQHMQLCLDGDDDVKITCHAEDQSEMEANLVAYVLLLVAGACLGLGNSGLITIGIAFIDENVKKENSAMYIGVASSMHIWGPIIGFSLAAFATRMPEDLGEPLLSPYHPSFIGCWWLGSVVIGILLCAIALPMFCFPKHFPSYYIYHKQKSIKKLKQEISIWREVKEFPKSLWRVLTNAGFMLLVLSKTFCLYYIMGVAINLSRYIEIHFGQPAFIANVATALCGALVGGIGSLFGGFIMKRLKLQTRGAVVIYLIAVVGSIVGLLIMMSIPCPQVPPANHDRPLTPLGLDVNQQCNADCSCSRDHYQPVCTREGVEFFSPCYAGCHNTDENQTLSDCSCLEDNQIEVSAAWCGQKCNLFMPYMVVVAICGFLGSMARVPGTVLIFRLVDPDLKAFAMGILSFTLNLLVFVPGPVLFGAVFDSACQLWRSSCGERRNCLRYDTALFRKYMHGVTAIFQVGGLVLAIAMFLVLRKRFARESAEAMVDKQKKLNGTGENEGGVMLKSLMKKDEDNNDTTT